MGTSYSTASRTVGEEKRSTRASSVYSRRSQASRASSKMPGKGKGILLSKKARYLGRFFAREVTDESLLKLRSHVHLIKGVKTKIRLSMYGIGTGEKYSTVRKNRLPHEFVPLAAIADLFVDEYYNNLLMCIVVIPDGREILAYRLEDPTEAKLFQHSFEELMAKASHDRHLLEVAYTNNSMVPPSVASEQWTLRHTGRPVATIPPSHDMSASTLRSHRSHHQNGGVVGNSYNLDDAMQRKANKSQEYIDWNSRRHGGDKKPARKHSDSSNGGTHLKRTNSKSDVFNKPGHDYPDNRSDHSSNNSTLSARSMKKELLNLSREVRQLRGMFTEQTSRSSIKDLHNHTAESKDLHNRTRGSSSSSGSDIGNKSQGKLIDYQAGVVTTKIGGHRQKARHTDHVDAARVIHRDVKDGEHYIYNTLTGRQERVPYDNNFDHDKRSDYVVYNVDSGKGTHMYVGDTRQGDVYMTTPRNRQGYSRARTSSGSEAYHKHPYRSHSAEPPRKWGSAKDMHGGYVTRVTQPSQTVYYTSPTPHSPHNTVYATSTRSHRTGTTSKRF